MNSPKFDLAGIWHICGHGYSDCVPQYYGT